MSYLILNRSGHLMHAVGSSYEAEWLLRRDNAMAQWLTPHEHEEPAVAASNPPAPNVLKALQRTGLPSILDRSEVERISLKEAYYTCLPYFWEARQAAEAHGIPRGVTELTSIAEPGKGLLAENAKLHKRDPLTPPAVALGLSLLPEYTIFRGVTDSDPPVNLRPFTPIEDAPAWATLCSGSSAECRSACLVYSGQNQANIAANFAKAAKTKALLQAPYHFLRLLLQAIDRYAESDSPDFGGPGTIRAARLNVFSDIPWELVAPWIFDDARLRWYDYTKLHGRFRDALDRPFRNYDLSFSYSGRNLHLCDDELQNGHRIVMVFVAPQFISPQTAKRRARLAGFGEGEEEFERAFVHANPLPHWISDPGLVNGDRVRVVDGDRSDVRFFDPTDVVVGLRWKPPLWSRSVPAPDRFVVKGEVVESDLGTVFKLPETPLSRPTVRRLPRA